LGDVEAYMPLPGSSRSFFMFAGPSLTWATRRHLQRVFGVTETQSLASGHPVFDVHGGTNSVGLGFSATRLITKNWLLNADAGINWLQGSAADSPITQSRVQRALAISIDYHW
jgi:outer membrane scaffolding protein for murein synthesis (MipA/OmpV family)